MNLDWLTEAFGDETVDDSAKSFRKIPMLSFLSRIFTRNDNDCIMPELKKSDFSIVKSELRAALFAADSIVKITKSEWVRLFKILARKKERKASVKNVARSLRI